MHLRDRAIQTGLFHSLPRRCFRAYCVEPNLALLRNASRISIEQWYLRHGRFRKGVTPRPKKPAKPESRIPLNTKDLFVNDLAATLEAHRATNRAKIIRKIPRGPPQYKDKDWKHLTGIHDGPKIEKEITQSAGNPENPTTETSKKSRSSSGPPKTGTKQLPKSDSERNIMVRRVLVDKVVKVRLLNSKRGLRTDPVNDNPILTSLQKEKSQPPSSQSHPLSSQPWMSHVDSRCKDCLELLSSEIRELETYMRLTPIEEKASRKVIFDVQALLGGAFDKNQMKMIGSRQTGLAIPTSDFDFHISVKNRPGSWGKKMEYQILRSVQKNLERGRFFTHVRRIHANVSLVRAIHRVTAAQVEFQAKFLTGEPIEQVKAWLLDMPSLRPLFITLRTCLEANQLRKVVTGGIGSYTLIVMIVTALRRAHDAFDPKDLGGQLLYILDFWGSANLTDYAYSAFPLHEYRKWDSHPTSAQKVSSRLPKYIWSQRQGMDLIRQRNPEHPYLLCLQDPADPRNDLGKKSYAIQKVQALFKAAHERISNATREYKEESRQSTDPAIDTQSSILQNLIDADFTEFELARSKLQNYQNKKRGAKPPGEINRDAALGREEAFEATAPPTRDEIANSDERNPMKTQLPPLDVAHPSSLPTPSSQGQHENFKEGPKKFRIIKVPHTSVSHEMPNLAELALKESQQPFKMDQHSVI